MDGSRSWRGRGWPVASEDRGLLLKSRQLITMAGSPSRDQDAVAVKGDTIAGVGPRDAVSGTLGQDFTTYDFGNRPIMPGFVDVHVHPEMASLALYNRVDVHTPPRETIDDVIEAFRGRMDMAEETGWLFGHGSLFQDQKLKDKRLPDRHDLDKVSTDIPVAMMAGGHNLILNSKALELVGIGPGFRVPAGATVELDDSGHPNGIIKDLEHLLPIPRPDLSTKEKALKAISREHLTANGVTTIGDISHSSEGIELADRLIGSGEINVRFRTYIWAPRLMSIKDACRWQEHLTINSDDKYMRIQGVKMFADGGYSAALAAVKLPYVGRNGSRGKLGLNRRQILNAMVGTREAGLQLIIHCNGERAQESMCKVAIELGDPPTGRMVNRMEHAGNFVSDPGTRELVAQGGYHAGAPGRFPLHLRGLLPGLHGRLCQQGQVLVPHHVGRWVGAALQLRRLGLRGQAPEPVLQHLVRREASDVHRTDNRPGAEGVGRRSAEDAHHLSGGCSWRARFKGKPGGGQTGRHRGPEP